jgi:hypothetical protein
MFGGSVLKGGTFYQNDQVSCRNIRRIILVENKRLETDYQKRLETVYLFYPAVSRRRSTTNTVHRNLQLVEAAGF